MKLLRTLLMLSSAAVTYWRMEQANAYAWVLKYRTEDGVEHRG